MKAILSGWLLLLFLAIGVEAQSPAGKPKVTQIDETQLAEILKPKGRPLLVNFWATWCDPCRDEFPDLVKLDNEYKGKIDFITVSLDFAEDLETKVPQFLQSMKAEMPTYLLITPDETAAIGSVNKDWQGGLPFTILYNADGSTAFIEQRVIKLDKIRPEIDKAIAADAAKKAGSSAEVVLINLPTTVLTAEKGVAAARDDIAAGTPRILLYGLRPGVQNGYREVEKRYGIKVEDSGCLVMNGYDTYARAYNATIITELKRKHGVAAENSLAFAPVPEP